MAALLRGIGSSFVDVMNRSVYSPVMDSDRANLSELLEDLFEKPISVSQRGIIYVYVKVICSGLGLNHRNGVVLFGSILDL
jgi:hypothetical protein